MKPLFLFLSLISIMAACRTNTGNDSFPTKQGPCSGSGHAFYTGTYTGTGSRGIYHCLMDSEGNLQLSGLAAETENPSCLALSHDGEFLLAVNEIGPAGMLESYRIAGDSLVFISRSPSGGEHPCFVSVNENAYVLTANYSSGSVALLKLDSAGRTGALLYVQQHEGKGSTDRQESPHAHSAYFVPGTTGVVSADLGTNEIWFSDLDTLQDKLLPSLQGKLEMEAGAGPRHIAFHPGGRFIYVINELNSTVTMLTKSADGTFARGPSFSTLPAAYEGPNYCADIHCSHDGSFLYASNRGHNSIAVLRVEPETGGLIPAGHSTTCGEWPRNFALSPGDKFLVVANQHSNNIVSFSRDSSTGHLAPLDTLELPEPVCILFSR